jgi:hypothetical protein
MSIFTRFADWLVFDALKHAPETPIGQSLHFFVEDTVKILVLLIVMTHLMSLLRQYLPVAKMRAFLLSRKLYGLDYFFASLFGAITPFCSCSSIPLFISFLQARIPLGLTFAFLSTSPLVNEIAIALFLGIFGWKITLLYVTAGMAIGMGSGYALGKMHLEKEIDTQLFSEVDEKTCSCKEKGVSNVWRAASHEAWSITRRITPFVLIGVALGAAIHSYVPQGYFEKMLQQTGLFSVPLAVLLAIPLYANASGVIPIIEALIAKGVATGTALAFMMAIVGLSLPEALILKRAMTWKLIGIFFGVVASGIIVIGYVFNALL